MGGMLPMAVIVGLIGLFILSMGFARRRNPILEHSFDKRSGTAIIITGAAAKIAQEAALLQRLDESGMLDSVVFISGASSGALNAVLLNGIIEKKLTWNEYREILGSITNDSIFSVNTKKKLPVSNEPLRKLIENVVVHRLGYRTLADLPIPTAISVVNLRVSPFGERTLRLCNRKINSESDSSLNLVEVLMASTAYPLVFPPARISGNGTIPSTPLYDGGISEDRFPYKALIQFEQYRKMGVNRVIVVTRKRDSDISIFDELKPFGLKMKGKLDFIGFSPDALTEIGFYRRLREYRRNFPQLAQRTLLYVPDYSDSFLMFDFDNLDRQWTITYTWALSNGPVTLNEFLSQEDKSLFKRKK